jgi:predicted aminopeptidase
MSGGRVATAALTLAAALLAAGCATPVGYLAKQGKYLLGDTLGARSARAMLADPATPERTRELLLRVAEIKRFAVEEIGLKDNGNYTRFRQTAGDHLADVVSACDAASFTPYMWSYPLLGKLPYMGFYERPDAEAEASALRKRGYDVIIRGVDAFSTLGFTKDPLYSFMEGYSPFALASLIIHEQTHATLFVKGQSQFNEELASFVGDTGALLWLQRRYGADSAEYAHAVESQEDAVTFTALLKGLSVELDAVYTGPLSREEKLARKAEIIAAFTRRLVGPDAPRFRTEGYRNLESLPLNNALLSLYSLYSDDVPLLRAYCTERCGGDLRLFMEAVRRLSRAGDVKSLMRAERVAGREAASPLRPR